MNRQEKLIAEIHAEFDTAQDRLLEQDNEVLLRPLDISVTAIESVGERLAKVGFTNTPTAKEAEQIKQSKEAKIKRVVETREQAELIQYYQSTYPFLKFLTEAELDRICKKYSLVYAQSENYTEEVPEKNLRDIETSMKLHCQDKPEVLNYFSGEVWCSHDYKELKKLLKEKCKNVKSIKFTPVTDKPGQWLSEENKIAIGVLQSMGIRTTDDQIHIWIDGKIETVERSGLFIAAPETHFNTKGLKKKGLGFFSIFETEIKDPIVFRYVRGGIQVLTKWGLEANDPALVVPKLN